MFANSDKLLDFVSAKTFKSAYAASENGARHLSCVLPAVADALGIPTKTRLYGNSKFLRETLKIPEADSAVAVVADGLGFWNIMQKKRTFQIFESSYKRRNQLKTDYDMSSQHDNSGNVCFRNRNMSFDDRNVRLHAAESLERKNISND